MRLQAKLPTLLPFLRARHAIRTRLSVLTVTRLQRAGLVCACKENRDWQRT